MTWRRSEWLRLVVMVVVATLIATAGLVLLWRWTE